MNVRICLLVALVFATFAMASPEPEAAPKPDAKVGRSEFGGDYFQARPFGGAGFGRGGLGLGFGQGQGVRRLGVNFTNIFSAFLFLRFKFALF
jgi:hypothetical protein